MRRILEDIVPKDHTHDTATPHFDAPSLSFQNKTSISYRRDTVIKRKAERNKHIIVFFLIALIVLGAIGYVSFYFRKVTLTITPHNEDLIFEKSAITATRGTDAAGNTLSFEIISVESNINKPVTLTENSGAPTKAVGQVTVYNDYSASAVTLPAKTVLKDTRGLSFTTTKKVVVPKYTIKNKVKTPGSITVAIEASALGASYNTGPTDFTFSNFSKLYARSTTAIEGGSLGKGFSLGGDDLTKLYLDASLALREKMFIQARAQTPPEYVLFRNASRITISSKPNKIEGDSATSIFGLKGTATYMIFKKKNLEVALASQSSITDDPDLFTVHGAEDLNIQTETTGDISNATTIPLSIDGRASAIWGIQDAVILAMTKGILIKDIPTVLRNKKEVASVRTTFTPFWLTRMPVDASRIIIKVIS